MTPPSPPPGVNFVHFVKGFPAENPPCRKWQGLLTSDRVGGCIGGEILFHVVISGTVKHTLLWEKLTVQKVTRFADKRSGGGGKSFFHVIISGQRGGASSQETQYTKKRRNAETVDSFYIFLCVWGGGRVAVLSFPFFLSAGGVAIFAFHTFLSFFLSGGGSVLLRFKYLLLSFFLSCYRGGGAR